MNSQAEEIIVLKFVYEHKYIDFKYDKLMWSAAFPFCPWYSNYIALIPTILNLREDSQILFAVSANIKLLVPYNPTAWPTGVWSFQVSPSASSPIHAISRLEPFQWILAFKLSLSHFAFLHTNYWIWYFKLLFNLK